MTQMSSLPVEVQGIIVDLVIATAIDRAAIPSLATVSRTWQFLVERHTLAELRLTQARVAEAHEILTPRRQRVVRTVRMDVLLNPYEESFYGQVETLDEQNHSNIAFTQAMKEFILLLATWCGPEAVDTNENSRATLAVHLDVFSPSDWGRNRDRQHMLHRSLMQSQGRDIAAGRFIGSYLDMDEHVVTDLPELPAIGEFYVGGMLCRPLMPQLCCRLASKMCNLRSARWQLNDQADGDVVRGWQRREDFAASLHCLPSSLRDFDLGYESTAPNGNGTDHALRPTTDKLSVGLRTLSQRLVTFRIGAPSLGPELFWPATAEGISHAATPSWPFLKSLHARLSIRGVDGTQLFGVDDDDEDEDDDENTGDDDDDDHGSFQTVPRPEFVDPYYIAAANAAAQMPELNALSIHWDTFGHFALNYNWQEGATPQLRAPGKPTPLLTDEVKEAWRATVKKRLESADLEIRVGDIRVPLITGGPGGVVYRRRE